jgi:hypothetical protein
MQTLLNLATDDEGDSYRLSLGAEGATLVVWAEGQVDPQAFGSRERHGTCVRVLRPGREGAARERVVFVGDLDRPDAKRAVIDTPHIASLRVPVLRL